MWSAEAKSKRFALMRVRQQAVHAERRRRAAALGSRRARQRRREILALREVEAIAQRRAEIAALKTERDAEAQRRAEAQHARRDARQRAVEQREAVRQAEEQRQAAQRAAKAAEAHKRECSPPPAPVGFASNYLALATPSCKSCGGDGASLSQGVCWCAARRMGRAAMRHYCENPRPSAWRIDLAWLIKRIGAPRDWVAMRMQGQSRPRSWWRAGGAALLVRWDAALGRAMLAAGLTVPHL